MGPSLAPLKTRRGTLLTWIHARLMLIPLALRVVRIKCTSLTELLQSLATAKTTFQVQY